MITVHCAKKPVTTMLTYPWKCTVLHCNHLGNTWKPVVSRCFPGGYNVKLYISRGRLAWWLLAFLHSGLYWQLRPSEKSSLHTVYHSDLTDSKHSLNCHDQLIWIDIVNCQSSKPPFSAPWSGVIICVQGLFKSHFLEPSMKEHIWCHSYIVLIT